MMAMSSERAFSQPSQGQTSSVAGVTAAGEGEPPSAGSKNRNLPLSFMVNDLLVQTEMRMNRINYNHKLLYIIFSRKTRGGMKYLQKIAK
jgi:hypothetical protein